MKFDDVEIDGRFTLISNPDLGVFIRSSKRTFRGVGPGDGSQYNLGTMWMENLDEEVSGA